MNLKSLCFYLSIAVFSLSNPLLPNRNALHADVLFFGNNANTFSMDFVEIADPGNTADSVGFPNPAGGVGYRYGIGKYEVSESMISSYNAEYGTPNSQTITTNNRGANKPATLVSWRDAARFVNWLNTSTGGSAAYKIDSSGNVALWSAADTSDYDSTNPVRSRRARFVLPSVNEWHKAAYYDPATDSWYSYPNGSNSPPTAVASGTAPGTEVFNQPAVGSVPADVTQAGGPNPNGLVAMGGNVTEWGEPISFHLFPGNGAVQRGANWLDDASAMLSTAFDETATTSDLNFAVGFRVVMLISAVPEPQLAAFVVVISVGTAWLLRRSQIHRRRTIQGLRNSQYM
ncbi:MAG: hypothetical protein RLZZ232_3652 [Planctomycetota bacterium]|jgi:hypothetical protein